MNTTATPRRVGRPPVPAAEKRRRLTVTLSPEALAFVHHLAGLNRQGGVSGAVEHLARTHRRFAGWQKRQQEQER